MTENQKRQLDRWLVRVSLVAGILNTIASAAGPVLDAPAAWSISFSLAGCFALLATVGFQRHALKRHQPLLNEKDKKIGQLTERLVIADAKNVELSQRMQTHLAELKELADNYQRLRRLRAALPIVLEANTELRDSTSPESIRASLSGDMPEFVAEGAAKLLTSLRNGLRVLSHQNGDDDVTCALHVGCGRISSVYAAGTSAHRKVIERAYVRASHSLPGLVRHYPTALAGDSLEDHPPLHNGETHSAAGWSGNISRTIQSFLCLPVVINDGRNEKAIGVLQVDSPMRAAFPPATACLMEAVADGIGILFQLGVLADQLQKQQDPLLKALRELPATPQERA